MDAKQQQKKAVRFTVLSLIFVALAVYIGFYLLVYTA
jgi:hypothetical protein